MSQPYRPQPVASSPMLRPGLRWLLAAMVVLSAVAMWLPQDGGVSDASSTAEPGDVGRPMSAPRPHENTHDSPSTNLAALPAALPRQTLGPARFDPFKGPAPAEARPAIASAPAPAPAPAPASPPAPAMAMAPLPATQPLAPTAPPIQYRYLGSMKSPDGTPRSYLARGEAMVAITVGVKLEDGYVVESIDTHGIRLHYPPLNAYAVIPVPPPPEPDRR